MHMDEIKDIKGLKELELDEVSGGTRGGLYGVSCRVCGHFGLREYSCKNAGGVWQIVFQCPVCDGYTFESYEG